LDFPHSSFILVNEGIRKHRYLLSPSTFHKEHGGNIPCTLAFSTVSRQEYV
jgi:hypothetical protein